MIRALAIGAAAFALWQLSTLVLLLLAAIVIASAVEPGVAFFLERKFPRPLAVVSVYILVLACFATLIWFFVPPLLDEAFIALSFLPQYLSQVGNVSILPFLDNASVGPSLAESIVALQEAFANTGAGVIQFLSSIFGGVFYFLLTVIVSIYFSLSNF